MDQRNRVLRGIYALSDWISRLFYANVLWILFTFAGLGVFGLVPSTVALFAVTRRWIMGEMDLPLLRTFWGVYRNEFVKANFLGLLLLLIGFFLYWDIKILRAQESTFFYYASFLILGFFLIYVITVFYVLPFFVHREFKILQTVKLSFIVAFTHPLWTLLVIFTYLLAFFSTIKFPSVLPFFTGSLLACTINWIIHRLLVKIEAQS